MTYRVTSVYNITVQLVSILIDEIKAEEYNSVKFDNKKYASGKYVCRIQTDEFYNE